MKNWIVLFLLTLSALTASARDFNAERVDFRDESIYFVMTTRFYDGDPQNNTYCWDGSKDAERHDPEWRGDFKGLIDRLDYIKALGFTAVWITPVVENASGFDYHGYHARDFSRIDRRFETHNAEEDISLQQLVDAAHAKDMKIIVDIVFNHTGNFGEATLCPLFERDWTKPQSDIKQCMVPTSLLPADYADLPAGQQYDARLRMMKNTDGKNHDIHNYWHHHPEFNWDDNTRWWAQIAGDCVDLNTENPAVYEYLLRCYSAFVKMGVDGFRIDTSGHIARTTFNAVLVPRLLQMGEQYKTKRLNQCPLYLFGEVCARFQGSVTYRNQPALSPYFYTWKSDETLLSQWNDDATYWDSQVIMQSTREETLDNQCLAQQEYAANNNGDKNQPRSTNAQLAAGDAYHLPDYSQASGLHVIDFPVHYSFNSASEVWPLFDSDPLYNDATWNVVYVDSHDYCPGSNDGVRFNGGTAQWAENLSLMFTHRGIPCLFYGSEIEFRKGQPIDRGPNAALFDTGRAYYGGYLKGNLETSGFGLVSHADGNVAATLSHPLVQHLQRLNRIRQAIPALRKGQWSREGCRATNGFAFKRRYTCEGEDAVDSYALIALNSGATFTGIQNGTYRDCITDDVKTVDNHTLTTDAFSGKGNLRIYVLNGPGKIGDDGPFLYGDAPRNVPLLEYDGTEEDGDFLTQYVTGGGTSTPIDVSELEVYTPSVGEKELSVFYEQTSLTPQTVSVWVWNSSENFTGGSWPGQSATLMGTNAERTSLIYKWIYGEQSVQAMPTGLIFSHRGQNQTSDLVFQNHGYYIDGRYDHTVDGGSDPDIAQQIDNPQQLKAWFLAPKAWTDVYCWAWDAKAGNRNFTGGHWPGVACTVVGEYNGLTLWLWDGGEQSGMPTGILFSNHGSPQTKDFTFVNGATYNENGIDVSGINTVVNVPMPDQHKASESVYTIDGRRMNSHSALPRGLYVKGRKLIVK